ncbi:PLDc_N domain-containing protein [Rhodococcus sp. ABRD24]|uniref:PLD nuclease N-terminal domain-containing protein n=1 Tax=Rhodococcus sp. ABRD24 TaxID=2507582 RepID=UPI00103E6ECE|nr:PLD nuclease N-terminal domain-containing protein [Rhodococcus sp. ABRD24]QBJ95314.1 PLDc_N domain-containing protein [Rhodococcus sp. ABRD24]
MDSFWDWFWFAFAWFAFAAYLMVLIAILTDLVRDHRTSGWMKAVWVLFLFVVPVLTAVVYLIVRGRGMAERSAAAVRGYELAEDLNIGDVTGTSADRELATARALLDEGTINADEYRTLAARARRTSTQ